jgi:hypothetical protein
MRTTAILLTTSLVLTGIPAFAQGGGCEMIGLTKTPEPVESCGATNLMLDGTSILYAVADPAANKYQFHFTNVAGQPAYDRKISSPTNTLTLTQWYTKPLKAGRRYNVEVRASYDNGVTWCPYGWSCTIKISWFPIPQQMVRAMESDVLTDDGSLLSLYPNPSADGGFSIQTTELDLEGMPASLDVFDATGKQVASRSMVMPADGTACSFSPEAPLEGGLYIVRLSVGDEAILTTRLVVR